MCVLPQCQSIDLYSSYTQPTNTNTMLLSNHLWDILIFVKDTKRRYTLRCLQMDSLQAGLQLSFWFKAAEAPATRLTGS